MTTLPHTKEFSPVGVGRGFPLGLQLTVKTLPSGFDGLSQLVTLSLKGSGQTVAMTLGRNGMLW